MERKPMTLSDYIDRKRQLEVEIAHAAEVAIDRFQAATGTVVSRACLEHVSGGMWTSTVEVAL